MHFQIDAIQLTHLPSIRKSIYIDSQSLFFLKRKKESTTLCNVWADIHLSSQVLSLVLFSNMSINTMMIMACSKSFNRHSKDCNVTFSKSFLLFLLFLCQSFYSLFFLDRNNGIRRCIVEFMFN